MAKTYTATVFRRLWSISPTVEFPTITACRNFAEEYGDTADYCIINDAKGREVARHQRDNNGDGSRWYRAAV